MPVMRDTRVSKETTEADLKRLTTGSVAASSQRTSHALPDEP